MVSSLQWMEPRTRRLTTLLIFANLTAYRNELKAVHLGELTLMTLMRFKQREIHVSHTTKYFDNIP